MIKVANETDTYIQAWCPYHGDRGRPNLRIDKVGDYAGQFRCWACGAMGSAKDLGISIKRGTIRKRKPKDFYSIWLNLPYAPTTVYEWPVWNNAPFKILESYGMKYIEKEGYAVYPMCGPEHKIIGLQRRFPNDRKVCVKGSRLGVFAPNEPRNEPVYVCEGFSDTISVASLSLFAIGRPCASSVDITAGWIKNWTKGLVTIVSDNNDVGVESSEMLRNLLTIVHRESRIVVSKEKDVREDVKKYGSQVKEWIC